MSFRREPAIGTAILALLSIAALGAAWTMPWFEYDFSSGRKTAPDGPYNEGQTSAVHHHLTFYADHQVGDVEPADAETTALLVKWMPLGLAVSGGLLLLAALGEIPFVDRVIRRRVAIALLIMAIMTLAATAGASWVWLPESMAAQGVDSQFEAQLDEPSGYTSTQLLWGWYAVAAAIVPAIGATLFKFQAGIVRLDAVAHLLHRKETTP